MINWFVVLCVVGLGIFISVVYECFVGFRHISFCKYIKSHNGNGSVPVLKGRTFFSNCSRCKCRVMQDKFGNWLEVSELEEELIDEFQDRPF